MSQIFMLLSLEPSEGKKINLGKNPRQKVIIWGSSREQTTKKLPGVNSFLRDLYSHEAKYTALVALQSTLVVPTLKVPCLKAEQISIDPFFLISLFSPFSPSFFLFSILLFPLFLSFKPIHSSPGHHKFHLNLWCYPPNFPSTSPKFPLNFPQSPHLDEGVSRPREEEGVANSKGINSAGVSTVLGVCYIERETLLLSPSSLREGKIGLISTARYNFNCTCCTTSGTGLTKAWIHGWGRNEGKLGDKKGKNVELCGKIRGKKGGYLKKVGDNEGGKKVG